MAVQNEHVVCSSDGLCLLSVMHCTMGAPSAWASHSGDCPSSLLPDGVSLPAGGTGDPTVYISAGDGVHLPECDTNAMEGRRWFTEGCNTIINEVLYPSYSWSDSNCLLCTSHTIKR